MAEQRYVARQGKVKDLGGQWEDRFGWGIYDTEIDRYAPFGTSEKRTVDRVINDTFNPGSWAWTQRSEFVLAGEPKEAHNEYLELQVWEEDEWRRFVTFTPDDSVRIVRKYRTPPETTVWSQNR